MRSTLLAMLLASHTAFADCVVPAQLWDHPRTARRLIETPELKPCVRALTLDPAARLAIVRGGTEEAELRAEELRGWLIALGLDAARIGSQTRADSGEIALSIVK